MPYHPGDDPAAARCCVVGERLAVAGIGEENPRVDLFLITGCAERDVDRYLADRLVLGIVTNRRRLPSRRASRRTLSEGPRAKSPVQRLFNTPHKTRAAAVAGALKRHQFRPRPASCGRRRATASGAADKTGHLQAVFGRVESRFVGSGGRQRPGPRGVSHAIERFPIEHLASDARQLQKGDVLFVASSPAKNEFRQGRKLRQAEGRRWPPTPFENSSGRVSAPVLKSIRFASLSCGHGPLSGDSLFRR